MSQPSSPTAAKGPEHKSPTHASGQLHMHPQAAAGGNIPAPQPSGVSHSSGSQSVASNPDPNDSPKAKSTAQNIFEFLPRGQTDFWNNIRQPYFDAESKQDWFGRGQQKKKRGDFINGVRSKVREGEYSADESKIKDAMKTVLGFGEEMKKDL